jgi:thermitase
MEKLFYSLRAMALAVAVTFAASAAGGDFIPGQILVKPQNSISREVFEAVLKEHGAERRDVLSAIGVHVLGVPEHAVDRVLEALKRNPHIAFAERDFVAETLLVPNDTFYASHQWHLPRIEAPKAWDITTGTSSPVIAVLDTGVNALHPDLSGKVLQGYDYVNKDNDASDDHGHGTQVSGTAAAWGNNGIGVAGVAFGNYILPVKVLSATGSGSYSAIASGITYAADRGARIINMSLGGTSSSSSLQSAVDYAWSRNAVLIAAAGNDGTSSPRYPAACNNVVAVSATDSKDALASFSSYGSHLDVAAPGVNIVTTGLDGYVSASGTSFAAPVVAGTVALMGSVNGQLSNVQLVDLLKKNAVDLGAPGFDNYFGHGRVDAYRAVNAARSVSTQDTTAPVTSITSPASGSTVAGVVTVNASASDNTGVTRVDLYVDGKMAGTSSTAPAAFAWDTLNYADGSHTLQTFAYDAAGNVGKSAIITVAVENARWTDVTAPSARITSPVDGQVVSRKQQIYVMSSDNVQVVGVELYINGAFFGSSTSATPVFTWNTQKAARGEHRLQAVAYDAAGNVGVSDVVRVIK